MPPPIKDTSFRNFIQEFYDAPVSIPEQAWEEIRGMYYKDLKNKLTTIRVRSSVAGVESSLISTFVAGGQEALLDIKGVNTTLDLQKLIKNPLQTIQNLGQQTFKDITKLDELAGDRRSDMIEALTKGHLVTIHGSDVLKPQNWATGAAKGLGLRVVNTDDLVEQSGLNIGSGFASAIRLLGSNKLSVTGASEDLEDRRILESGANREAGYKAYRDLAGSLTALSGYMENPASRVKYYQGSLTAYNRGVASELGINLDDVLPIEERRGIAPSTMTPGIYSSTGSFKTALQAQVDNGATNINDALEDLLNDEAKLRIALGLGSSNQINGRIWANLNPESKEFLKDFLRSEFVEQKFYSEKFKHSQTGVELRSAFQIDAGGIANSTRGQEFKKGKWVAKDSDLKEGYLMRESNRRSLRADLKSKLSEKRVIAAIANSAEVVVLRAGLDNVSRSLGLPPGSITDINDARVPQTDRALISNKMTDAASMARDRFISLTKASKLSHNLFFASTTKELLESIENKKFVETFLLSTKLMNVLPFSDPKWGTISEYVNYIDTFGIVSKASRINGMVAKATGLAFEEGEKTAPWIAKKFPKAFESESYVGWKTKVNGENRWTQARIKAGTQRGLFGNTGDYSLHEVLSKSWGESGQLFYDFKIPNPQHYNPANIMTNLDDVDDFLGQLEFSAQNILGAAPASPMEHLAHNLKLDVLENIDGQNVPVNLNKFRGQIKAFQTPGDGGRDFLIKMSDSLNHPGGFALPISDRWDFIKRIAKEGRANQLTKTYAGLLNRYNRFANAVYTFLYREIIWGGYNGTNPLLIGATKIFKPFLGMLSKVGFGDDVLLIEAINKWSFVQHFHNLGSKFTWLGANSGLATNLISRSLVKVLGSQLISNIGYILGNFGGIVSGGIGYLLAGIGSLAWAFSKKALSGDIGGGFREVNRIIREKIRATSKLATSIFIGGCSCLVFPLVIIFVVFSMMASTEPSTGGGAYSDIVGSQKLQVEKTSEVSGNRITYLIKIKNIDPTLDENGLRKPVTITSFVDTLRYSKPCSDGGGIVEINGDTDYGNVNVPQIGNLPKTTLAPDEEIEVGPFTLTEISTDDGTYFNSVEVIAQDEAGRKAEASVSDVFGAGGCSVCPAGWPTQPFTLTQSAYAYSSHANANAIDMAASIGRPVKATHDGVAFRGNEPGGYGNYVKVISPRGFSTIYAHLDAAYVSTGDQIVADEDTGQFPEIGLLGTSGRSTGPHLHYEFVNNIECLGPGKPLGMRRYNDTPASYIPESIPDGCVGDTDCNMRR